MSEPAKNPARPAKTPAKAPSKRAAPPASAERAPRSLFQKVAATFVVVVLLVVGGQLGWLYFAPLVRGRDIKIVTPEKVAMTPPPAWVPAGLKTEVLRGAGLDQPQSLLDEDLARRYHTAFSLNPWVRSVRVTKHPDGVQVDLNYREPVLMVEVSGRLEPVDAEGIRLPEGDIAPAGKTRLPRLSGVSHGPSGPAGTAWGSEQVTAAARVAAALAPSWTELGLANLEAAARTFRTPESAPDLFYLFTKSRRTRIIWGHAPGISSSEPSAEEKVSRLKRYLSASGSFDAGEESLDLDLRPAEGLLKTPRLAGDADGIRR